MKRIVKSPVAPRPLRDYIAAHAVGAPEHDWDVFCDTIPKADKVAVQQRVKADQRGICAYCEIDLAEADGSVLDGEPFKADFQIEHFHPKSDRDPAHRPIPNCDWSLYWPNLYGCCMGGAERLLVDADRFSANKPNRHCGYKKGKKILDAEILNPANIPAFPCLFKERQGTDSELLELEPDIDACNACSADTARRAQNSLDMLNLNCRLLSRRRRAVVQKLLEALQNESSRLGIFDSAVEFVMAQVFDPTSPRWPSFFTAIRAHFGVAAEARLHVINYQG